ncbi:hypothetical protein ACQ86N_41615 [Puia sp. P3]|uniref:hypothetical protein n=1 Tax=Puia sp. P3 TaxID=3423952 RepID=UPI003D671F26
MKAFVKPDLVLARRLNGAGFDHLLVVHPELSEGGIIKNGLCIGVALEIVKGFDGKNTPYTASSSV